MLHSLQSNARRLAAETRGAEIAEAAAVLPLMFMMLLGIFWFGQAFSIYGAITRAAQEGARAGAVPICATCPGTNRSLQLTQCSQLPYRLPWSRPSWTHHRPRHTASDFFPMPWSPPGGTSTSTVTSP